MIGEVRTLLRFAQRSFVIPGLLLVCAALAIVSVLGAAQSVRADYALLQHTRAAYAANHMDFEGDLHKPERTSTRDGDQVVGNLARYDYDTLASAIVSVSPASSVSETLKYFGFLVYPALFFLLGLWLATGQRRYRLEKVVLARAGPVRVVASRQLALAVIAALTIGATLLVDVVARAIAQAALATQIPLGAFVPLTPPQAASAIAQWGVILLVTVFFGGAGLAIGTFAGVFAIPAIVFLAWDFVVPILGAGDPRDWFEVLGHAVFAYSAQFELAEPIPLALSVAVGAAVSGAAVFVGLGYVGIRIRNPRAT